MWISFDAQCVHEDSIEIEELPHQFALVCPPNPQLANLSYETEPLSIDNGIQPPSIIPCLLRQEFSICLKD
jgi:hypothetical protein